MTDGFGETYRHRLWIKIWWVGREIGGVNGRFVTKNKSARVGQNFAFKLMNETKHMLGKIGKELLFSPVVGRKLDFFVPITGVSGSINSEKQEFLGQFKKRLEQRILRFSYLWDRNVSVDVIFYFREQCTYDLDNMLKSLLDSLQGIFIKNDRQVKKICSEIREYSFMEGISIKLEQYN